MIDENLCPYPTEDKGKRHRYFIVDFFLTKSQFLSNFFKTYMEVEVILECIECGHRKRFTKIERIR